MRVPVITGLRPPQATSEFVPSGTLDEGDMFLASPATDPELCVIVENPRTGTLLQVLSLETGSVQSLSKISLVQQVTTTITVVGDIKTQNS